MIDVDLVIIATPTNCHISTFREAVRKLSLNRFFVKSLLVYLLEAKQFLELEVSPQLREKTYVNYIRRADPSTREIYLLLDSLNASETKSKGFCYYTKGVFNTASHFLDLLQIWFGPCNGIRSLGTITHATHDLKDINCDFIATFANAEVIFLSGDEFKYIHYGLDIYLNCGRIRYDFGGEVITFSKSDFQNTINTSPTPIKSQLDFYQRNIYSELYKG